MLRQYIVRMNYSISVETKTKISIKKRKRKRNYGHPADGEASMKRE